jgi:single-strand DNA-binding protein
VAVAGFSVASTARVFDRDGDQWRDGETLYLRCSVWREPAEHVAESLRKGTRVIVSGRLVQRGFTGRDGQARSVVELEADEVGASLRYVTATITKASGGNGPHGEAGTTVTTVAEVSAGAGAERC